MKIVAIVQARMGSTRLPGKVLMDIHGLSMMEWVFGRVNKSKLVNQVVLATTESVEDDVLVSWSKLHQFDFFRGSEKDVLSRFYFCAKKNYAEIIVRITADDPLKDPVIIDEAINKLISNGADYCSNTITPTYPEGLDIEVFTFKALEKAFNEAHLSSEREHVTPYIWKNPNFFKISEMMMRPNLSGWRWTVDKVEDLEFIRKLIQQSKGGIDINYQDLISVVSENASLLSSCTNKTMRNEGYIKSISNDVNLI